MGDYIWNGLELVGIYEGNELFNVRTDHIARPVFATNASGTVVWEASYFPFGGVQSATGGPDLRFPGQWFQSESGLHQNWMRDYDPTLGRYLQADPLGLIDAPSVYGYALQNPGRYVDPEGLTTNNKNNTHKSGGPYHPPDGVKLKCTRLDLCPRLAAKLILWKRVIDSHQGWENVHGDGKHVKEISDLKNGARRCFTMLLLRCPRCVVLVARPSFTGIPLYLPPDLLQIPGIGGTGQKA